MKTCFKCNVAKERTEFYEHSAMADGLLGKCKECTKADARKRYVENPDKIREYEKSRANLPHRVALRKEYVTRPEAKERKTEYTRERRALEPEKYAARTAVGNAVRDGRLGKLPCNRCGSNEHVQGHHHDYSKPLEVEWLCVPCHSKEHHT